MTRVCSAVPHPARQGRRRLRSRSAGFATAGLVVVIVGAMALTLFGAGTASRALDVDDANIWFWSTANGSTQRVNTDSGKVDMRYALKDAQGHNVEIIQTDNHLLLHDRTTGAITSIALSGLDVSASLAVQPGTDVSVAMWRDVVVLADASKGILRRLDPEKLSSKGEPLSLSPGLIPGKFDNDGRYWALSPADGTVICVTAQPDSMKLKKDHTVDVAPPDHSLKLTVLDHGAAIVDRTGDRVVVVNDNTARTVSIPNLGDGEVTARTNGSAIAIAVPKSRQVVLVDGDKVRTLTVPGKGELGQVIMFAGRLYVTDTTTNQVLALDKNGAITNRVPATGATVTMEQREGVLAINQPDDATSYIVNKHHSTKKVTKYTDQNPDEASNSPKNQTRLKLPEALPDGKDRQAKPHPDTGSNRPNQPAGPQPSGGAPAANTAVPTNVQVREINGGQNIQVTWNSVKVPTGATLENYKIYTCTLTCIPVSTSRSTSVTYSNPTGDYPVWFTVSSVMNGKESAQSEPSNHVGAR